MFEANVRVLDPDTCSHCNRLAKWFVETYQEQIADTASFHVWINDLQPKTQQLVDKIRYSPHVLQLLSQGYVRFEGIRGMDEIYLTPVNGNGGDMNLTAPHYDGVLGFLPDNGIDIIRVLICISGNPDHVTTFQTSKVSATAETCSMMAFDFQQELHQVRSIDTLLPSKAQKVPRVLLKLHYVGCKTECNRSPYKDAYVSTTQHINKMVRALLQYSNNPRNGAEHAVGLLTNWGREFNMEAPHWMKLLVATVLVVFVGTFVWACVRLTTMLIAKAS